ncbi:MAG: PLP-dependent aspartate aminotransferase family protein [Planctomycetaceae bacterium]|nr:PLP-dependent aspartate aminotransferase family protein [Planctomycetaceae bacterium]
MDEHFLAKLAMDTQAVHAGRNPDYSSTPIHMASTGKHGYTRHQNPSIEALEAAVAAIEGGGRCVATACGMAAVTQTLLGLLTVGDRIVTHRCVYSWTDRWMNVEAERRGITVEQIDLRDMAAVERALQKPTRMVYFEPLANAALDMLDAKALIDAAHAAGALAVVDNSYLTPALLRPLDLGADVVIHTATKFMCGHGDAMGGVATSRSEEIYKEIYRARNIYGGVISPFNAFLILRGIATLPMRIARCSETAMKIARFLSTHPQVIETRYVGLASDPGHATATKYLKDAFGGMVGFILKGGSPKYPVFSAALKLCKPWVSLGDVETLVLPHWTEDRRGINEGYVRISAGLENADDIITDLDRALRAG